MNLGSWHRKKKEPKQKQQTLQSAFKKNGSKKPTSKTPRGMAQKSLNSALQKATAPEHDPLNESNDDAPKETSMDIDNSEVEVMQVEPAATLQSPTNSYAAAVQGSIANQNGNQVEVTPEKAPVTFHDTGPTLQLTKPGRTGQTKLKSALKKGKKASYFLNKLENVCRLQMKLIIGNDPKKSAGTLGLETFVSWFDHLKAEVDDQAVLMPWKNDDTDKVKAIPHRNDFPQKISEFKPYADRFRPKSNSFTWVKVRIATNAVIRNLTSQDGSDMADWFDDNGGMSFLCTVQESDQSVQAGTFIYSGAFIDHRRLTRVIMQTLKARRPQVDWKIGCRTRQMRDVERTNPDQGWITSNNQIIHFECDRSQAKNACRCLNMTYNKTPKAADRPGGYKIRFAPDPKIITTGSNAVQGLVNLRKKHQAVVASLGAVTTEEIKELDKECTIRDERVTLRETLMQLTYPLAPKPGQKTSPLLNSIDWVSSGRNADTEVVATALLDRFTTVQRLFKVLPQFVLFLHEDPPNDDSDKDENPEEKVFDIEHPLVKEWFHPQFEVGIVEFHRDEQKQWTGEWTTEDDAITQGILDEDMGVEIDMNDISSSEHARPRHIIDSDNMSLMTFGLPPLTQTQPAPPEDSDQESTGAVASTASGSNGQGHE